MPEIPAWAQNKLKKLKVTRVDLVEDGADAGADIKIAKNKGGTEMTLQEILKSMDPEHATVVQDAMVEMQKTIDAQKDYDEVVKAKQLAEDKVVELEKAAKAAPADNSEEELLKSVDPAIRALIEKSNAKASAAEAVVLKMKEEHETEVAKSIVASIPNIPGEADSLVGLYKSIAGMNSEVATQVFDVLKQANTLIEKDSPFVPKGSESAGSAVNETAAWNAIEKAAEPIAIAKSITKEQAISLVIKEKPALYDAYLATQA